jgi:hypothetical protein
LIPRKKVRRPPMRLRPLVINKIIFHEEDEAWSPLRRCGVEIPISKARNKRPMAKPRSWANHVDKILSKGG